MRKVLHRREVCNARESQRIGHIHRDVQRMVVAPALRALHPVHDAAPPLRSAATPHSHPRILCQLPQFRGHIRVRSQIFAQSRINRIPLLRAEPLAHPRRAHHQPSLRQNCRRTIIKSSSSYHQIAEMLMSCDVTETKWIVPTEEPAIEPVHLRRAAVNDAPALALVGAATFLEAFTWM